MQENQGVRLQTELKKNLLFNNRVACFGFQILAFKPKLQGIINLFSMPVCIIPSTLGTIKGNSASLASRARRTP